MKEYFTMDDFDFKGKTVLVRVDINSPVDPISGAILDYSRFEAHRQTLMELKNSKVIILAHQSRPGKRDFLCMRPHSNVLTKILGKRVKYVPDLFGDIALSEIERMEDGEYIILENTRFYSEEYCLKKDFESTHIVENLSSVADYFINDAFAAAHRAQTTLVGFKNELPMIAGRLMDREITNLTRFMTADEHPKIAIIGGAKVDDSLKVAESFLSKGIVDKILVGGVVAHFFLMAAGYDLGEGSLNFMKREYEAMDELLNTAKKLLDKYSDLIEIPTDIVINANGRRKGMPVTELPQKEPIYDIGLDTAIKYRSIVRDAKAVVINGPMGVFELPEFAVGTVEVFKGLAECRGFKVAGGGHTIAVLEKLGLSRYIDHISTGGGSLITFLSGGNMPVIDALKHSYRVFSK